MSHVKWWQMKNRYFVFVDTHFIYASRHLIKWSVVNVYLIWWGVCVCVCHSLLLWLPLRARACVCVFVSVCATGVGNKKNTEMYCTEIKTMVVCESQVALTFYRLDFRNARALSLSLFHLSTAIQNFLQIFVKAPAISAIFIPMQFLRLSLTSGLATANIQTVIIGCHEIHIKRKYL